ncbi:MAG TPA: hypothetical protein VJR29_13830 [bacterium]|nr:hypothetical protein [bacterium]
MKYLVMGVIALGILGLGIHSNLHADKTKVPTFECWDEANQPLTPFLYPNSDDKGRLDVTAGAARCRIHFADFQGWVACVAMEQSGKPMGGTQLFADESPVYEFRPGVGHTTFQSFNYLCGELGDLP